MTEKIFSVWEGVFKSFEETGDISQFVSHQVFYDKRIPHIFININEFLNFMSNKMQTSLLFKAKFIREILAQDSCFPNQRLKYAYRIERQYHLVFSKL